VSGIDDMLASLQRLKTVDVRAAQLAAPLVEAAVKKTAAAGTSPSGKAWAEKKGGGRAMKGAAGHLKAQAIGNVVRVSLTGPDVFHNYATTREPRRQVIPDVGEVPPEVARAVRAGIDKAMAEALS
jgi:hypothetical protein